MTRLEALTALRDAVKEGGAKPTTIIGLCKDADLSCSLVLRAHNGSLDAAHDLHKAVLPEWQWLVRSDETKGAFANTTSHDFCQVHVASSVTVMSHHAGQTFPIYAPTPARAWLLAILEALIAEQEE